MKKSSQSKSRLSEQGKLIAYRSGRDFYLCELGSGGFRQLLRTRHRCRDAPGKARMQQLRRDTVLIVVFAFPLPAHIKKIRDRKRLTSTTFVAGDRYGILRVNHIQLGVELCALWIGLYATIAALIVVLIPARAGRSPSNRLFATGYVCHTDNMRSFLL